MNSGSQERDLLDRRLTGLIVGAFYVVYDTLGVGFLESVYRNSLAHELRLRGLSIAQEAPVDVWYRELCVGHFRADLLVESRIILEVKASDRIAQTDQRQLLNYLRCSKIEIGMLLYFGEKPVFRRLIHTIDRKR